MLTEQQKKEIIRLKSEKFKKTAEERAAVKAAISAWKKANKNGQA